MVKMCFVLAMAEFVMVKSVFAFSLLMGMGMHGIHKPHLHTLSLLVVFGEIAHYRVGVF